MFFALLILWRAADNWLDFVFRESKFAFVEHLVDKDIVFFIAY